MTTYNDGQTSQMICHGCGQVLWECDEYFHVAATETEQAPQYLCAECGVDPKKRPNDRPVTFHYATSQ